MTSGHLGDRVSALVDGELSHEQRERALSHLARCAACRAEVEAERQVKATIREQVAPAPSGELVAALLQLAEPGAPLPPDHPPFPGPPRRTTGWRPGAGRPTTRGSTGGPGGRPPRAPSRLRRGAVYAAGGVLTAMTATVALALLGGSAGAPAPVVPPVEQLTVEHERSTSRQPFAEPAVFVPQTQTEPGTGGR